jgi:hypothetical protein
MIELRRKQINQSFPKYWVPEKYFRGFLEGKKFLKIPSFAVKK